MNKMLYEIGYFIAHYYTHTGDRMIKETQYWCKYCKNELN